MVPTVEMDSPRALFKKARKKSIKEVADLSSVGKSPHSNNVHSHFDIENGSIN
jgi:adenylylsulfate kinase-like enzyme